MTQVWTAATVITAVIAWLGLVWAQAFQKYQDHASQLFKDFDDSGAIDAALARIDSQQVDVALVAVINVANKLRDQSIRNAGNLPDIRDVLSHAEVTQARASLATSIKLREDILQKYDHLKHVARRARESALSHMPCMILGAASFFYLSGPSQTIAVTIFVVLAIGTLVFHFIYAFKFGRRREEFQQCLKPRDSLTAGS